MCKISVKTVALVAVFETTLPMAANVGPYVRILVMTTVQLDLSRVDYMVVGITAPQTMKLLPNQGAKLSQKVAVADRDGVVQVFSLKRGDVQVAFKTLPGPPASCLELGGAIGTVQDKIFVALKNEVHGYLKKGKLFLAFDTNQTEHISSMHVSGSNLLVCGRHVYSQFYDCVDTNSYVCGDQINDVVALPAEKSGRLVPVLACEDGAVRVLDRSQEAHCVRLPSAPAVLHLYRGDAGDAGDQVLYGAADGSVGLLQVSRTGVTSRLLLPGDAGLAAVTCMDCYDLTGDGTTDLLVGRQDGSLEVYPLPDPGEEGDLGASRLSYTCNESITSIQGGVVGSPGCDEIVAATYTELSPKNCIIAGASGTHSVCVCTAHQNTKLMFSGGWIFGLTTELVDKQVALDADGGTVVSHDLRLKLQRLRAEVEEIELKVAKEREKYQDSTLDKFDGVSAIPYITINDKMTLVKQEACYRLLLEAETAIDNVLVQSEVPLHLLDVDKNSAVVSYSECEPASGNCVLVTYRCQANTTRLELKVRTVEGQHGTLRAYITPLVQPKCCQLRLYHIRPLSLHARCHAVDEARPYNVLTLKGGFSLAEMHSWVCLCLPEVPEKPPAGDKASFCFVSTFLDTMLQCCYWKGVAEFKSDNISTISILKDILTKEATKKKIKLDISYALEEGSTAHTLRLLYPRLEAQVELARKVALLGALEELGAEDGSLLPDYRSVLDQQASLRSEFKRQPAHLDRLYGMITDLFIDKYKFKGVNVKGRTPQLLEVLQKGDLQELLDFFEQ